MKTVTKQVYHGVEAEVIVAYEDQLNTNTWREVYEQTKEQYAAIVYVDQQVYWQVQCEILNTLREG